MPVHPLVDNGEGYPTLDSACEALRQQNLAALIDAEVVIKGETMMATDMIRRCSVEKLIADWPPCFVRYLVTGKPA